MDKRILITDDELGIRETMEAVLITDGFHVMTAKNGTEALEILKDNSFEVMLLDLMMPDYNGLDLLPKIKKIDPNLMIIIMTGFGTIKTAVEAVKEGAFDFITKPFDLEEMRLTIEKALKMKELTFENKELKKIINENLIQKNIIGSSPKIQSVFEIIKKIVDFDVTVLITGESGTGKELIAQAIHYNSLRSDKPFIKLNCASLPETLLESELFGYEKGAFTGALISKPGRFELADGGTLFLDEIGDTSLNMQSKLLRVIQEKEFERVGGNHTIKTNIRIVTATNKDLKREVEEKRFREDLFYRLNVVPINLPPLRERKEDIPSLVNHFLKEINLSFHKNFSSVSPEAMEKLLEYNWPGNIRELKNVIEKVILLGDGNTILIDYLPEEIKKSNIQKFKDNEITLLENIEKEHIQKELIKTNWNQSKAAENLGIHRNSIKRKIDKFNLKKN